MAESTGEVSRLVGVTGRTTRDLRAIRGVTTRADNSREMPRPKDPTARRPPCPKGHQGDIWLDGFYGRDPHHERPRFRCVPRAERNGKRPAFHADGSPEHKFIEPLARRHPVTGTGASHFCEECEHVLDRHEGPQTTRRQVFTIREAAHALVEVAQGHSMRKASWAARESAHRYTTNRWGQQEPSEHGQLSSDHLAMFGTLVRDALMPREWPDAVALDETSFDVVVTDISPSGNKVSQPGTVSVLGVYGYAGGRGSGRAITLAPRGGADRVEWEAVLRSREKEPAWVVCDQGKAVMSAVKAVWPNATVYVCEAHLRMLGEQRLAADGFDRHHPLWASLRRAIPSQAGWEAFEQEVRAAAATRTLAWMSQTRPLMDRQWAIRDPARPHSIGGLETVFTEAVRRLGERRFVFRNRERLELVLDLMALDMSRLATERRFREVIRAGLLANGGRPVRSRRSLDDHGSSSLYDAVRDVEARLAHRRAQNAKAQRAHLARRATAGQPRARTPSRRPRQPRTAQP